MLRRGVARLPLRVLQRGDSPPVRGFGGSVLDNFFCLRKHVTFLSCFSCRLDFHVHGWAIFRHMVFVDGFLFSVKELGLLTNPGHWVRVSDVVGSYMYIVL
jgi:hypothetical protein